MKQYRFFQPLLIPPTIYTCTNIPFWGNKYMQTDILRVRFNEFVKGFFR